MTVPKKLKKVTIDDRFKAALTSKDFNLVQKVDKRGKRVDQQDTTMASFYQLEEKGTAAAEHKYYDEEGKFKWEAQSSSDSGSGEEEDEKDEEEEEEMEYLDEDNVWDELDKEEEDAIKNDEEVEIGNRLAL